MAKRASAKALALPRVDLEEKALEVRLRLKGKPAQDLIDYQRAYQALNGAHIEQEQLVQSIVTAFIEADRGFQAWRRSDTLKEGA